MREFSREEVVKLIKKLAVEYIVFFCIITLIDIIFSIGLRDVKFNFLIASVFAIFHFIYEVFIKEKK